MREETRAFLKELIDFYEASGRQRWTTIRHFWKVKKVSTPANVRKWLRTYNREGIALLERQTKPRKPSRLLMRQAVGTAKRVWELLQEDPNISNGEGGAMLNMSPHTFWLHKRRFTTPGMLTPEMKIQIGIIPGTLPEIGKPGASSAVNVKSEGVNIKKEKFESEMFEDDNCGDTFEDDIGKVSDSTKETESTSRVISKKKPDKFHHCLLCYVNIGKNKLTSEKLKSKPIRSSSRKYKDNPSVPIVTTSFVNDCGDGELGENLNVIFALKNIFGLTSSDLVIVMKATNGSDPKEWYDLCESCDVVLKETIAVQHQILQLSRELEKCKMRIQDKIQKSAQSSKSKVNEDNLVSKLIRESIMNPKKNKTDPSSAIHGSVVIDTSLVKQEPQDIDDECDRFLGDSELVPISQSNDGAENSTEADDAASKTAVAEDNTDSLQLPDKPKLVVCETCGEEMRPCQLPVHCLRVHDIIMEGFTVFKCPKEGCKYTSILRDGFKRHMLDVHTPYEKRKHVCQTCGKRFSMKTKLKAHEKSHTNALTRPYQCEICGSSFALYATLYHHRKCVHEKNPKYTTRKKRDPTALPKPNMSRKKVKKSAISISNPSSITSAPAPDSDQVPPDNSLAISHITFSVNEGSGSALS